MVLCLLLLTLNACTSSPPLAPWQGFSPKEHYTIELPSDWEKADDETVDLPDALGTNAFATVVSFQSPDNKAQVLISDFRPEFGWLDSLDVDAGAKRTLGGIESLHPSGFKLVDFRAVSPMVRRSTYEYDSGSCEIEGNGLHVWTESRMYFVAIEICHPAPDHYDEAFVNRVLDSFASSDPAGPGVWKRLNLQGNYTVDVPSNWETTHYESPIVTVGSPDGLAILFIIELYAEFGWPEGYGIDQSAGENVSLLEGQSGFDLEVMWDSPPRAKRSIYRYDQAADGFCDIEGNGLHVLTEKRMYFVTIEVCQEATVKYGPVFANRLFESFSYFEETAQPPWQEHSSRSYYTVETPSGWTKTADEDTQVSFASPDKQAFLYIFDDFALLGWTHDFNLGVSTEEQFTLFKSGVTNFNLTNLWEESPGAKRSTFEFDGIDGSCNKKAHGLHMLTLTRNYFLFVEVCQHATAAYGEAFVNRMLDSFTYTE